MISRVAEHCFWFGRYLERAESIARVLHVTRHLALDGELAPRQCWLPVVIVSGEQAHFEAKHGDEAAGDGEIVQRYLTWDEDNLACLRRSIAAARENARSIREVVSLETWETVNELYLWVGGAGQEVYEAHRHDFYARVRERTQLCLGLLRSTMLHDTPLDFIWLGMLLERVGQTARILDVHHHALGEIGDAHQVVETALWLSLLRACSGYEPFMKRHQGKVTGSAVARFLVLEARFPRSIRYCLHAAYQRLCAIRPPTEHDLPGGRSLERLRVLDDWLAGKLREAFEVAGVHELLTHVVDETTAICDELGRELLGQGSQAATPPAAAQ